MDDVSIIQKEIRRLSILIACGKHDYEMAVRTRMCEAHRKTIADEVCEYERQKKCLESGNFRALPYNIKMLYNSEKK